MRMAKLFSIFLTMAILLPISTAQASEPLYLKKKSSQSIIQKIQPSQPQVQPQVQSTVASDASKQFASLAKQACVPGKWETPTCLKVISENTLVMASNYGAALEESGKTQAAENIKQHCAAATAASRGEYPAYAMRSAYVECVNMVYDMTESTRMKPDLSQYQLLVGAVQCLDKSTACKAFEYQIKKFY